MKKIIAVIVLIAILCGCCAGLAACGGKNKRGDDLIYIRNLYFGNWSDFNDDYTTFIEEKFGVKFTDTDKDVKPQSYDFSSWDQQVNNDFSGDLPDLFQANIDSYNFNASYIRRAGKTIKALPDEVLEPNGRWKNLAKMLNGFSDIEYLKYNGKLYGIPLARNIQQSDVPFSPFTYVYRRDIAIELGVYKENDEYTWEEFEAVLEAFKDYKQFSNYGAIGDSEWGYPSIMNFYKTASHCFAIDGTGEVVNNYCTPEYLKGLEQTKAWKDYYLTLQGDYALKQNMVKEQYVASQHIGILYENLSLSNYLKIYKDMGYNENKCAIMKVKGPDGNYALEEQEQWFSMSLFSNKISDAKMEKILDIMDWLLSEEGTMMALYGIKGQDYTVDKETGKVTLLEGSGSLWHRGRDGNYTKSASNNGARYLRYIVTLGNDLNDRDPLIQGMDDTKVAYDILEKWNQEMMDAYKDGGKDSRLKILKEDSEVKWMQNRSKQQNASELLSDANSAVLNYAFYQLISIDDYKKKMNNSTWQEVLKEINENRK